MNFGLFYYKIFKIMWDLVIKSTTYNRDSFGQMFVWPFKTFHRKMKLHTKAEMLHSCIINLFSSYIKKVFELLRWIFTLWLFAIINVVCIKYVIYLHSVYQFRSLHYKEPNYFYKIWNMYDKKYQIHICITLL